MLRALLLSSFVVAWLAAPLLTAAEAHPGFELIQQNCLACHAEAQMSGLDLRTRNGALNGGSRGPAIVPGNAGESLLMTTVRRVGDLKMPPGKAGLSEADVAVIAKWIDEGAPWPEGTAAASAENLWWSFRKPSCPLSMCRLSCAVAPKLIQRERPGLQR